MEEQIQQVQQVPEILTKDEKDWALYLEGADIDTLNQAESEAFDHLYELGILTTSEAWGGEVQIAQDWAVAI